MAFASVTVTGTYIQSNGTAPASGHVEFRLVNAGANQADDEIIVPGAIVEQLDGTGSFSTTLPTSSSVGGQPWQVVEVVGGARRVYFVEIPDAGPVDLADLAPIGEADLSATYVNAASLKLASLDDTDMTGLADGNTITYDLATQTWIAAPPDVADDQAAVDVPFTPAGTLAATDVQAALEELDTEKSPTSHDHAGVYSPVAHNHDADYADVVHAHGDLYYTEAEVDSALAGKSDTSHNHSGTYEPLVNSIFLGPDRFSNVGGGLSVGLSAGLSFLGYSDAATKQGGCNVGQLPSHWTTYDVEMWWTNGAGGTGDVVWQFGRVSWGDGDSFTGMTDSTKVTATAPVAPTIEVTTLASGIAAPASGDALAVRVIRFGSDGPDTLGNEAWGVGLRLVKAS